MALLSSAEPAVVGSPHKAGWPTCISLALHFGRAAGWWLTVLVPAAAAAPPSEGEGFCCHALCALHIPLLFLALLAVLVAPHPPGWPVQPPPPQGVPPGVPRGTARAASPAHSKALLSRRGLLRAQKAFSRLTHASVHEGAAVGLLFPAAAPRLC